jgi:hypothetical protein
MYIVGGYILGDLCGRVCLVRGWHPCWGDLGCLLGMFAIFCEFDFVPCGCALDKVSC